jgi:hypothetical protein
MAYLPWTITKQKITPVLAIDLDSDKENVTDADEAGDTKKQVVPDVTVMIRMSQALIQQSDSELAGACFENKVFK